MIREDVEQRNRELQQKRIDEQHQREAEARPNHVHRALLFLLQAAVVNNPDLAREAEHFRQVLDNTLTVTPAEQLAAVDQSAAAAAAPAAPEPTPPANRSAALPANEPPDTQEAVRLSSRFGGRGGNPRTPRVQRPTKEKKAGS